MKKHIIIISLLLAVFLILGCKEKKVIEITEQQKNEMRSTALDFMKTLKGVLISQIQTNGIVSAFSVCSDTAQVLTNNFGLERGVFVRRMSFRNRNENNYPDNFEGKILTKFEMMHNNNELNDKTEHIEIVEENEFKYLRYMKPILVQAECLNCHGEDTDRVEAVNNLISQKYPKDKAINYGVGDLRGAVSVKKLLE